MKPEELEQAFVDATLILTKEKDNYFEACENVLSAKSELDLKARTARMEGKIDGKNAEAREDQVNAMFSELIAKIAYYEQMERTRRVIYERAVMELDLLKYRLRIMELAKA